MCFVIFFPSCLVISIDNCMVLLYVPFVMIWPTKPFFSTSHFYIPLFSTETVLWWLWNEGKKKNMAFFSVISVCYPLCSCGPTPLFPYFKHNMWLSKPFMWQGLLSKSTSVQTLSLLFPCMLYYFVQSKLILVENILIHFCKL